MVDLKALAGSRYRITLDESAEIDRSEAERPWYYQIPCRYGHIWVCGKEALGAYVNRNRLLSRLMAIKGVKLHQRGDFEANVSFPPELLDTVADLLKARRRRQVSEAERERLAEMSRAHGFRSISESDLLAQGAIVGA